MQALAAVLLLACQRPAASKQSSQGKTAPTAAAASTQSTAPSASTTATSEPGAAPTKDELKLTMSATAPIIEPTPITPQKTDPECEAQGSPLADADKDALFSAYIEIQKEYLTREKGVKDFKLNKDPKDPLQYELSFVDIFGSSASMKYKFGKAVSDRDGKITLCLDEGNIMLWAGTYKRDPSKKFIPDL